MSPFSVPMSRLTPQRAAQRISLLKRFLYLRISGVSCARSCEVGVTFTEGRCGDEPGGAPPLAPPRLGEPPPRLGPVAGGQKRHHVTSFLDEKNQKRCPSLPEGDAAIPAGEPPGFASAEKPKDRKDFCFSCEARSYAREDASNFSSERRTKNEMGTEEGIHIALLSTKHQLHELDKT